MKKYISSLSVSTKMFLFAAFILGTIGVFAQQQQSGGFQTTSVSISSALPTGANTIGAISNTSFGITGAIPTGSNVIGSIANTSFGITGAIPTGANTIGAISNTSFGITGAIPAGTNMLGFVRNIAPNTCGTTEYDSGITFLPNTTTALTATNTCVQSIILNNTDTAAHTITITDNSTACNSGVCTVFGPSFSMPGLSETKIPLDGVKLTGGIKWSTDTANKIVGVVRGNQ